MKSIVDKQNGFNIVDISSNNYELSYEKPNLLILASKDLKPIVVKKDQHLTVVEWFHSSIDAKNLKREIQLKSGATLEYIKLSMIPKKSFLDMSFNIKSSNNSKVKLIWLDLGEGKVTNRLKSDLEYENIDISLDALVKIKEDTEVFNSIDIVHKHPNTKSDIKIRHLLDDNAKADFEAKSVIENEALYSKAFQDSKTILLSDDAKISARPHLEILTDELEASHGATTGGLDQEAIYYMQSRGIDEQTAKEILIDAFCDIPITKIENEFIRDWINKLTRG